jgi:hypothetical protein
MCVHTFPPSAGTISSPAVDTKAEEIRTEIKIVTINSFVFTIILLS